MKHLFFENFNFHGSCDQQSNVEKVCIIGPYSLGFPNRGGLKNCYVALQKAHCQRNVFGGLDIRSHEQAGLMHSLFHTKSCFDRSISTPTDLENRTAPGFSTRTRTCCTPGSSRHKRATSAASASTVCRFAVSACANTFFATVL